jgi:outer membrane protein W
MIRFNRKTGFLALGVGTLGTFMMIPRVHAELVYENGAAEPNQIQTQVDDRAATRQNLESSEKAQATMQAQQPAPVQVRQQVQMLPAPVAAAPMPVAPAPTQMVALSPPAPVAALDPAASSAAPGSEAPNMSHSEMLRRERMRTELKNEDVLQTRLEELRLRDEQKRTNQILAPSPTGDEAAVVAPSGPALGLQQQAVVAPVTEHPGQPVLVPALAPALVPPSQPLPGQQVASIQNTTTMDQTGAVGISSASSSSNDTSPKDKSIFGLTARGGISNMSASNLGYSISPQFSAGIAGSVAASDYLSIELGYTYSQYGVSIQPSSPFVQQIQNSNAAMGSNSLQSITLNQNVIDAGIKFSLLGPDSRIRPFVSGGVGYSKAYVNYNQATLNVINSIPGAQSLGTDYDLTQYLGYVGGGLDVKLARNITLGFDFKYYDVLSSSESNGLNNYAFYGGNPYANGASGQTADKQYVGGSLSTANFYTAMAGLTFNM